MFLFDLALLEEQAGYCNAAQDVERERAANDWCEGLLDDLTE
jgi:hypothetical protein